MCDTHHLCSLVKICNGEGKVIPIPDALPNDGENARLKLLPPIAELQAESITKDQVGAEEVEYMRRMNRR
jgi:hypothetical protein